MNIESYINKGSNYSKQAHENSYVGYVNGKLTRFILLIIPKTNQVVKVEIA